MREILTMRLRMSVVALVATAAVLDATENHGFAYLLLVLAVPISAAAALLALGESLATLSAAPAARLRTPLAALVLVLVLVAAASRAPLVAAGEVPAIGSAMLIACLAVLALDTLLAAVERLAVTGGAATTPARSQPGGAG